MTTSEQVTQYVSEITGMHPDEIGHFSDLKDSLGMDSMDIAELAVKVEAEFDISIPNAELWKIQTVGDLVKFVENALPVAPRG